MWRNIVAGAVGALLASVVLGIAGQFTSGSLIRFLGGATPDEVEDVVNGRIIEVEGRIIELSHVKFDKKYHAVTQDYERRVGIDAVESDPELQCDAGWLAGPVFSESYQDRGANRKYIRLCFRQGP